MHISATKAAIATAPSSAGKSALVPQGLAPRGLALPPGIAKKLDDGGAAPAGIANGFPPAGTPETPIENASDAAVLTTDVGTAATTPLVDVLV